MTVEKKSNRGGARPGSGRPKGLRNKTTLDLKTMLEPLDALGVKCLEQILQNGSNREKIDALELAWGYRHGKPKQELDVSATGSFVLGLPGPVASTPEEWQKLYGVTTNGDT